MRIFLSENFHVLVIKFSVYLNRRVLVMLYRPTEMHPTNAEADSGIRFSLTASKDPLLLLFIMHINYLQQ